MSRIQRFENLIVALLTLACAALMIAKPDLGYAIAILILSISLVVMGVRGLVYYFTMARHMVGGRMMLYKGIILLDLGMFSMTLADVPTIYVILYLVGAYLISGGIYILGAVDAIRTGSSHWKLKLSGGIVKVLVAAACIVFINFTNMIVYLFCVGLICSAIMRIITALQRTAIVYIQ